MSRAPDEVGRCWGAEICCPDCKSFASSYDLHCFQCGAPLSRLHWRSGEGDWQSASGKTLVRAGMTSIDIELSNFGTAALSLVLAPHDCVFPGWIDADALEREPLELAAGKTEDLEIPLVAEVLAQMDSSQRTRRESEPDVRLCFHTGLFDGRSLLPRKLDLILYVAREPRLVPAAVYFPFLPVERLANEGLAQEVRLSNESADEFTVGVPVVSDTTRAPPPGLERLLARDLLHPASNGGVRPIAPGESSRERVCLRCSPERVVEGPVWFSAEVRYQLARHPISLLLEGVIGRAPSIQARSSLDHMIGDANRALETEIGNPGDVPVRVRSIEILRESGDSAPAIDWLRVDGLAAGDVLGPRGTRTLRYRIQPDDRPEDELDTDLAKRTIRIRHDGYGGERLTELRVKAQLGKIERAVFTYLGVDFGTSSSMVSVCRSERSVRLVHLDSLIFYDGRSKEQPFLFGEEAVNARAREPINSVRSMKSLVAGGGPRVHAFRVRDEDGTHRWVEFETQELVNRYIAELRRRAEEAVRILNPTVRDQLGLSGDGVRVRFVHAAFTHPVDASDRLAPALLEAAHAAGLEPHIERIDDFRARSSLDEASAAVLAYVYQRAEERVLPTLARERVVCVDIGAGTTDLAAVEVVKKGEDGDGFEIVLAAVSGDSKFGGDRIDAIVACILLDKVEEQSRTEDAPVNATAVRRAIACRSFSEFDAEHHGEGVFTTAVQVLAIAERLKCDLSDKDSAECLLPGSIWPRHGSVPSGRGTENYTVEIKRTQLEAAIEVELAERFFLLDRVVENAGWTWANVDTLLLTGQASRTPCIQRALEAFVKIQQGGAGQIFVRAPVDAQDDFPKACVSAGASYFRHLAQTSDDPWICLERRVERELSFDLQQKRGPGSFKTLIERGRKLPAVQALCFQKSVNHLVLFKDGQEYVRFQFDATTKLDVHAHGPGKFEVDAAGHRFPGEVVR